MILGVIPARGGSKGIPRKNLKMIAGKPLIVWSIEAARRSKRLDRFVVSTEDAEIAEVTAIVYVRGKLPDKDAIDLAKEKGIVMLWTNLPMYESCGRLHQHGLPGGSELEGGLRDAERAPLLSTL